MKVLLVSSTLTFTPGNYDPVVLKLAEHPFVQGLVLVENRNINNLFISLFLMVSRTAPGLGWQMLKNFFGFSVYRKKRAFLSRQKDFQIVSDLNNAAAVKFIKNFQPDLIFHSRSRTIFKEDLLSIPTKGCWNLHHGILPEQKGLMCDFWAHLQHFPAGFSIHQMTDKLDSGPIWKTYTVPKQQSYIEYLQISSMFEVRAILEFLEKFTQQQSTDFISSANKKSNLFKNPKRKDFLQAKRLGFKV